MPPWPITSCTSYGAERAEQTRPIGRVEEVQVRRLQRGGPDRGLSFVQPLQDLRQGRVGGHGGRVADLPGQPSQHVATLLGLVKTLLASRARLQVLLVAFLLVGRDGVIEQRLPAFDPGAVQQSGHGGFSSKKIMNNSG